jgi:hypothetical protein
VDVAQRLGRGRVPPAGGAGRAERAAGDAEAVDADPGRIPTESAIEQTYGVARTTARHAVAELRARGLVYTVPARGTFVGTQESAG